MKNIFQLDIFVNSITYNNEDFYILNCTNLSTGKDFSNVKTKNIKVVGKFNEVYENDVFTVKVKKDKYNNQVSYKLTSSPTLIKPAIIESMGDFIYNQTDGIGKVLINRLLEEYGVNTLKIIEENPNDILKIKGFSPKKVEALKKISNRLNFEALQLFFQDYNLTPKHIPYVLEELQDNCIAKLINNPYIIAHLIGFNTADILHQKHIKSAEHPLRLKFAVYNAVHEYIKTTANMYIPFQKMKKYVNEFLKKNKAKLYNNIILEERHIEKALTQLIKDRKLVDVVISSTRCIYLTNLYNVEKNTANELKRYFNKNVNSQNNIIYDTTLSQEQNQAISMVLNNDFSILVGGPGTGKTSTIKAIIENYKTIDNDSNVKLLAPTGKAANRIMEQFHGETSLIATTIHLELISKLMFNNEDYKIDAGLVIVDEVSMIDAELFYTLITSLNEGTKLVLVGDDNQLPSVSPGNILNTLIVSNKFSLTRLTKVFRQKDMSLLDNINKVANDELFTLNNFNDKFQLINDNQTETILNLANQYKSHNDIILSPKRQGAIGVDVLNNELQNELNGSIVDNIQINDYLTLKKNDKVIQTVNNYELKVFNGMSGIIQDIIYQNDNVKVIVQFSNDLTIIYDYSNVYQLELAYALTIHKSQGSEYNNVILILDGSKFLDKKMLYTAITRTKEKIFIVGSLYDFNKALMNKGEKRLSNLEYFLEN